MADLSGSESLEINAPIEHCFAIAADVERAPEWQGSMKSAEAIEHDPDGRPLLVETHIDALVARVRLQLRFDYAEPTGMTWTRESGDLKSLEGAWVFEELGSGLTRATYSLEIGLNRALSILRRGVRGPAEAKVRQLLARRPLEGLKQVAEDSA